MFHNIFIHHTTLYRAAVGFLSSLVIMLVITPVWIKLFSNITQPIRKDGPLTHLKKKNTATMGGVPIILVFTLNVLLWCRLNIFIEAILFCSLAFGLIGALDDIFKLIRKNSNGVSGKLRLALGTLVAVGLLLFLQYIYKAPFCDSVYVPYISKNLIFISYGYFIWVILTVVGTANAVNLTDGLDGLLSFIASLVLITFAVVCYNIYHPSMNSAFFAKMFHPGIHVREVGEIIVLVAALMGVLLGFLCFNCFPAKIFMGDVGSLFLGGVMASIAVLLKHELLLLVSGIIFVLEALSVIIQVGSFKLTGKRVFLMAPLHHHFEKLGLHENTIVSVFFMITVLASAVGLLLIL